MNKVNDNAFRAMCNLFGVDEAIKVSKRMGIMVTDEQIVAARANEAMIEERWASIFKPKDGKQE